VNVADISPVGVVGQVIKSDGVNSAWSPVIDARQGNSATNWNEDGNTNFVPTGCLLQCGSCLVTIDHGSHDGVTTVTFPTPFSYKPLVFVCIGNFTYSEAYDVTVGADLVTATTFKVNVKQGDDTDRTIFWLAIGPR
jgi:hypothetical protein